MDLTLASIMAYIEYFDRHSGLKSPSLEGDVPSLEAYALVHLCISKAIFLRCTSINYISEAIFHGRTIMHGKVGHKGVYSY